MPTLTGWRYCPRCTTALRRVDGHVECDACGFHGYATSAPTASAFVLDDSGRLLLGRRAFEPDERLWDAPGGFLEEGEEPIAGLRRELREETGLEIDPGDFVGIYVDFYGDTAESGYVLNLVWEARLREGRLTAADDVSELRWFPLDGLPPDEELAFRWLAPALRDWAARRP